MDIKKQKEIIERAAEIYYDWMRLTNSTWDFENDEPTDQWRILQVITNNIEITIKHLNDIMPPWED